MNELSQHRRAAFSWPLICLTLLSFCQPVRAEWIAVNARAIDPKSEELLYSEHHQIERLNGIAVRHRVIYRTPEGDTLATKVLDYQRSAYAPSFELVVEDGRYIEGARWEAGDYLLYHKQQSKPREEKRFKAEANLIVDAGFDNFMRAQASRIQAGETISFRMAAPGVLRAFDFRARMTKSETDGDDPQITLHVEPDSFLRWLIDPLLLSYATTPMQLKTFNGRTNIPDANGERFIALIEFDKETPIPAPNWSKESIARN